VKREFCSLTAAEALRIAILVEERNAQIYQQLGDLFLQFCPDFPSLALSFLELETAERHHASMLSTRFRERYGNLNLEIAEEEIRDFIEVPKFDAANVLTAVEKGQPGSARHIALEIANAAERSALYFYSRLAANTLDPELKSIYEEFVALEQEHVNTLDIEMSVAHTSAEPNLVPLNSTFHE
jgi:rubrerythrin